MNSIARIALALLTASLIVPPVRAAAQGRELDFGYFITAGGGVAAHDNGAFSRRLKSYTPVHSNGEDFIYQTEDFSSAGGTYNASLGMLAGGTWVIGASGERVTFPTAFSINAPGNPRDEYDLSAMGGGLDIGYAAINDDGVLVFPYLHAGYYSYALDYANNQPEAVPFFEGKPVPSGTTVTYTGGAPRLALGIGLVKIIGVSGTSPGDGFTVGARVTWGMMLARPEWKEPDGGVVNNGGLTPGYNGVSLSIQIGFGGGTGPITTR